MKKKNYFTKKPFFSIITVVKNDQANIQKTIKSILGQSFKNFEYIIIDGKSQDNTLKNIKRYRGNPICIVSEKDNGIYYAMNKGIKRAKGHIVVFVNSGDILTKNALKIVSNKFNNNPKLHFVFGTVRRKYTKKTILKYGFDPSRLKYNFDFATSHTTGFFIKLRSIKLIGYFNTKYKCSADYDFYYKAIIKEKLIGSSTNKNQLIGIVNSGGFSSKITFFNHLLEETKIRLDNKQNVFFVFLIFMNAIIKNILKKIA